MQERNIYSDIAKRTQGDIYIGVVGPVRTGKSTFIKRFMDALVLPNIESQSVRDRATDQTTNMTLEAFSAKLGQEIADRV